MRKLLALACVLAMPHAALAQSVPASASDPAPPLIPQWGEIETVDSRAAPGPALWHVTKGNSEVWIVGTVGSMPKDLAWNKHAIVDLMDGAGAVITPPGAGMGLFEASWMLISYGGRLSLPRGQKLEDTMPPAMRARFAATRTLLGQNADRYETDTPVRAALRLMQDFGDKFQLRGDGAGAVSALARQHDVPRKPAATFEAAPIIKEVLTLPVAQQNVCLEATLEDIDRLSKHAQAAAEAWAVGDVKGVKAHFAESRLFDCMAAAAHTVAAMNQNSVDATVTAIDTALQKPGKTIALVSMGPLLRKGGVLEQLEARHLTIEGPAE
jgi:uncharacterized protein YbaP (TraB family)